MGAACDLVVHTVGQYSLTSPPRPCRRRSALLKLGTGPCSPQSGPFQAEDGARPGFEVIKPNGTTAQPMSIWPVIVIV